jgi:hypothetical protein
VGVRQGDLNDAVVKKVTTAEKVEPARLCREVKLLREVTDRQQRDLAARARQDQV